MQSSRRVEKQVGYIGEQQGMGMYKEVVGKQWSIGGETRSLWGWHGVWVSVSIAGRYAVKAFFLPNLLKNSCVLLRCNEIKQNIARYKAGSLIYSPLYI
jgi:hypothetical protein